MYHCGPQVLTSCLLNCAQSTPGHRACVHNTKIGDADCYATGDLVIPHPTLSGYWKITGRADDQLIHNTGENVRVHHHLFIFLTCTLPSYIAEHQTNPVPLGNNTIP